MQIPWHRRLLYTLLVLSVFYSGIEGVATWLWMRGTLDPESHWVYEENGTGWSYGFDPVLGYALSSSPARMVTTASNGVIECAGTIRGNNLGFPDDDDFAPQRNDPSRTRVAVFGDSFTAGYYVPRSWPVVAETAVPRIDFMNFAVDGGGLVNWWSVVTRLVTAQHYDLDGVVFAVFGDDLFRPFFIYDDGFRADNADVFLGRVPFPLTFDLPASRVDAQRYMEPVERYDRVSPERYEALLRGDWHPRSERPFRPFFATRAIRIARGVGGSTEDLVAGREFEPMQYRLMEDIGAALAEQGIPMLAVYLPWRDEVVGSGSRYGSLDEVSEFARRIGADLLDGRGAFEGLDDTELRDCWLRYDGHFSERGMERFGDFVAQRVDEWLRTNPAPRERSSPGG